MTRGFFIFAILTWLECFGKGKIVSFCYAGRKICAACLAFGSLQPTGILGLGAMLLGRDIEIPEAAPGLDLDFSDPVAMTALASFGGFRGWISNWLRLCVFWVSLSLLLEIGVWISTPPSAILGKD